MAPASDPAVIGFRLVTGRLPELEAALAGDVAVAQAEDPLTPVAVLIGGTLLRPYLQRRLATLNDGIVNVRFLTPSELALSLGERELVQAGRSPLPPLGDRILLREVAFEHEGYFEPVRETPGFADALHQLVRELRGAGYDGAALRTAVTDVCDAAGKDTALTDLFDSFLSRRSEFYSPDDCLLAADPARFEARTLHVYGLWDASPALRRCLEQLAEHSPVSVYLPTTATLADDAHADLRAWLEAKGAKTVDLSPSSKSDTGLEHLHRGLFHATDEPGPHDGTVRLLSAPNPTREVREAARACLGWAREGIRFHEMAIVYRHADEYRGIVETVFAEMDVPLYLHEGTPLIERPLGRRTAALLDLVDSDLPRRGVMDFLTDTRLPKATREEFGRAPIVRWDRLSRDAGIVAGAEQWAARLNALRDDVLAGRKPEDLEQRDAERVERIEQLARFVDDLHARQKAHPQTARWSEHLGYLKELLDRYVDGADPLMDALAGVARFDALSEEISFDRFREVVRGALENLRSDDVLGSQKGAFARRGVNVLDVNSLRHLRFRAVAVLGLTERVFPAPPRQDPLLLDDERERFNERGPAPLPLRARGPDLEPLQFALTVAAATERLTLSYPRKAGGEARPKLPSVFMRAAASALVGRPVTAEQVDELSRELYTRVSGSRIGAERPDLALDVEERDRTLIESEPALGRALLVAKQPRAARALEALAARRSNLLTPFDGVLSPTAVEALAHIRDPERPFSPSGLETYATCPQRFFLASVLRIKPVEEPEAILRISALDRGSLVHRILQRFLGEPPAEEPRLVAAGELDRLLAITDEECDRVEDRGETGHQLIWRYDRTELREDMRAWLEAERRDPEALALTEGDFEVRFGPRWFEEPEGERSTDQPLEIDADGVTLRATGRIDRLNWDPERTRFRVIDYKTGKARDDHVDGALRGGRALQLPLYMLAGARLADIDAAKGTAEYHFVTRKGQFARRTFSAADLAARDVDFHTAVATIARGIADGTFHLAPLEENACRWCDFDGLCPSSRWSSIERKANDQRAADLQALREIE